MLNVDLETLLIFKTVYETGCCGSASKKYQVSNSKVTRCLTVMRDYYRDSLFIRKKDGFLPTKKSVEIYPYICEIVETYRKISLLDDVDNIKNECVIAVPSTLSVGLPEYIDLEFPEIETDTTVTIKPLRNIACEDLLQGNISLAIIQQENVSIRAGLQKHSSEINCKPIGQGESVYIVAQENHPLWQTDIMLTNIAEYPFIITAVAGFNDKLDPFEAYCEAQNIPLRTVHKTHSLAGLIGKLRQSLCVSFIGTQCAAEFVGLMQGLRVQKMDDEQYQLLHSIVNKPSYSMVYRCKDEAYFPEAFTDKLAGFIGAQIGK
ncbi:LysR substrate-binding domain-containing protein [Shewanella waksmanii]|uniref:LysR substrate-binding domain-containing protein n=1 Tax=Shewanella waksmanii TaxID=213783 RepID=UPI0037351BFF